MCCTMRYSVFMLIGILVGSATGAIADNSLTDELGFDEIIFVKRKPYSSDHYYIVHS